MPMVEPSTCRAGRIAARAVCAIFVLVPLLAGCRHGYPPPLKEVGELAAARCAAYGRAPVFESDSPYDSDTAVTNFRCVPVQ
jgi:hypothetical protein